MQTMTLALKSLVDQVKQGPALGNSQASSPRAASKSLMFGKLQPKPKNPPTQVPLNSRGPYSQLKVAILRTIVYKKGASDQWFDAPFFMA